VQCDLFEPREPIPVGYGQTRRGWVVTTELCWSRVIAGALIVTAVALDTGQVGCRHRRVFAGGLTFTDPAHQSALERLRGQRRNRHVEVEQRPLARYDALIPA
jgi:hypothetical protein